VNAPETLKKIELNM